MRERKSSKLVELTLGATLLFESSLGAQPRIEHDDVDCLPRGEFTQFLASIQPASTVRAAKLYFRSSLYPEFYFVVMTLDAAGSFETVMPLPAAETIKVVYYIEAVDVSFQTSRSEELEVLVGNDSGCRRGPGAVLFPGGSPAIVVGAAQAGIPAIPLGFQASGITGFLTATGGIAAAGGAGIGVGVAVGAAAGAAAGAGVIVAAGGGSDGATTSAPPVGGGSTTSTPTTTSSASSTTTTVTGPATSTSSSTSTTTTSPPLSACFEWRALGNCRVFFDSCSTPASSITRYEWRMLGPPVPEPPQVESFTFNFEADPRCRDTMSFNHPVRLTVFDSLGRSDSVQQDVTVQSGATYRTDEGTSAILSFSSRLSAVPPDGRARGQIVVNGVRLPPSDNASASRHELRVRAGIVRIEVTLLTPVSPGSFWELDFSSNASLVAGSLKPEAGAAVGADERRIVFRLNGDRGETFRLRLSLR